MPRTPALLDRIPCVGWLDEPTPITEWSELAEQLGLAYLGVKRDDCIGALFGGSKVRKLDYLLAEPHYQDANEWAATGAIGSGQLVALSAAASALGHRLNAYVFWEPPSADVLDNMAYITSNAASLHFYNGRISTALHHPKLLLGDAVGRAAVIPVGATTPLSMIGMVRAALELKQQIDAGVLPCPDEVVVACGTGGLAAGLSVGFGIAGIPTTVRAVAVVERALSSYARIRHLQHSLGEALRARGVELGPDDDPVAVQIDRGALGRGYGRATAASEQACELAYDRGLRLESIYSGKALAALIAQPFSEARPAEAAPNKKVLFWSTAHGATLPHDSDWKSQLPPALRKRLEPGARVRRRVLLAAAAAGSAALVWQRCAGYPASEFEPLVLAAWEVALLRSVATVVLAPHATDQQLEQLPERVDRYLVHLPRETQRELHAAFATVEHSTTLFGVSLQRFTTSPRAAREAHLDQLASRGGLLGQCYRALRELCMLGHYQQPSSWSAIAYDGPRVPPTAPPGDPARISWPTYDNMRAGEGELPRGAIS
jgi:D-cysteine desulfhydrase